VDITLSSIGFAYGHTTVLRDINWRIRPGVTGLLGENGAGKTTLLSVLVGLRRPKSGSITMTDGAQPKFGFVPQQFSLPGEMRAADCVMYTAWINGVSRGECAAAAERALAQVNLADKARSRVRSLSGGQRQRLGLAAGLAHEPDVLVLDEPTVGLDPAQRVRVREVIADIGNLERCCCPRMCWRMFGSCVNGWVFWLAANSRSMGQSPRSSRRSPVMVARRAGWSPCWSAVTALFSTL
jgi:ABC-2 type transport system ATP-binding protein